MNARPIAQLIFISRVSLYADALFESTRMAKFTRNYTQNLDDKQTELLSNVQHHNNQVSVMASDRVCWVHTSGH